MLHLSSAAQQKNNVHSKKSSSRLNTKRKERTKTYRTPGESSLMPRYRGMCRNPREGIPEWGFDFTRDQSAKKLGCTAEKIRQLDRYAEAKGELITIAAYNQRGRRLANQLIPLKSPLPDDIKNLAKRGYVTRNSSNKVVGFFVEGVRVDLLSLLAPYRHIPPKVLGASESHESNYSSITNYSTLTGVVGGTENPLAGFGVEKSTDSSEEFLFGDFVERSTHNPTPRIPRRRAAPTPPKGRATPKAPQNSQKGTAKRRKAQKNTSGAGSKPKRNSVPKIKREACAQALDIYKKYCAEKYRSISRTKVEQFERKFHEKGWTCDELINRMSEVMQHVLVAQTTTSPLRVFDYDALMQSLKFTNDVFLENYSNFSGYRVHRAFSNKAIRGWYKYFDDIEAFELIKIAFAYRDQYRTWKVI